MGSNYNPVPTLKTVISSLDLVTTKTKHCDGCSNHPVRIWILRRAQEQLKQQQAEIERLTKDRDVYALQTYELTNRIIELEQTNRKGKGKIKGVDGVSDYT